VFAGIGILFLPEIWFIGQITVMFSTWRRCLCATGCSSGTKTFILASNSRMMPHHQNMLLIINNGFPGVDDWLKEHRQPDSTPGALCRA
jgi:hypothetical protein